MSSVVGNSKVRRQTFSWTGGLDYSLSEEAISPEHMSRADNVEYGLNNVLKKCDGIRAVFEPGAIDVAYPFNGKTVYNVGTSLYYADLTDSLPSATLIGNLAGHDINKQSFALRDDTLLVASGGHLQKVDATWNMATDSGSPYCDRAFIDDGRIMVALTSDAGGTDSDYLYWASIGNDAVWDLTPQPENDWSGTSLSDYNTTALFLEIGYRDGLDIIDMQQLSNDYIITKSDGLRTRQYRFTGKFPNWNVTDLAPSIPLVDAVGTINDIISVGRDGVRSFVNVMQYGDVQKDETGKRINSVLARDVTSDAKVWHIPSRKQVYVKPNTDSVLWIYHYAQRNAQTGEVGAWTKRYLTDEVRHIWEDGNNVYMAVGSKICLIDADIGSYAVPILQSDVAYDDTDIAFDDMDIAAGVYIYIRPGTVDGEEFPARISGQRLTSSFLFNPVHYTLQLSADIDGTGEVAFGGFREAINFVLSLIHI